MRTKDGNFIGDVAKEIVYSGKTSDIPKEIVNECVYYAGNVEEIQLFGSEQKYKNYNGEYPYYHKTAKKSIQSAVAKEDGSYYDYIIIFKKYLKFLSLPHLYVLIPY